MASKDDTALWLHNKLGSPNQLWSSSTIVSQYSYDKLNSIRECFQNLDSLVKIKFLLSLLHIPKRNIEEFKQPVKEIIENTIELCSDQWVLSIAKFMQPYWETQSFEIEEPIDTESFLDAFNELKKSLKKGESLRMLPLECEYLYKAAKATYAELPQSTKHFSLIRLAKSAAVLQDLKQKAANYTKNKKGLSGEKTSFVPYLSRSMSSKSNPLASHSSLLTSSGDSNTTSSSGFLKRSIGASCSTITGKASIKQNVGIKIIELGDQPLSYKDAKRKKREQEKQERDARQAEVVKKKIRMETEATNQESTYDSPTKQQQQYQEEQSSHDENLNEKTEVTEALRQIADDTHSDQPSVHHNPNPLPPTQPPPPLPIRLPQQAPSYALGLAQTQMHYLPQAYTFDNNSTPQMPYYYQNHLQQQHNSHTQIKQETTFSSPTKILTPEALPATYDIKPSLTLTRDQMLLAQEMFSHSNLLTRPQKALILSFIAGCRENPRPDNGPILAVKLNESEEYLLTQTGMQTRCLSEYFFQMNYETGEYKKIKKLRPIDA